MLIILTGTEEPHKLSLAEIALFCFSSWLMPRLFDLEPMLSKQTDHRIQLTIDRADCSISQALGLILFQECGIDSIQSGSLGIFSASPTGSRWCNCIPWARFFDQTPTQSKLGLIDSLMTGSGY